MNVLRLQSSHPIQVPIKHAEEVEQVFDAISYCKGSTVVRMASAILGKDKFREGFFVSFTHTPRIFYSYSSYLLLLDTRTACVHV